MTSLDNSLLEKQVIEIMQQAKISAIENNLEQAIQIKSNKISYNLNNKTIEISRDDINNINLVNTNINNSENTILFFPDGTSSGGILIINLKNKQKFKFKISSITGKIEMSE
jgi:hypothetical protein